MAELQHEWLGVKQLAEEFEVPVRTIYAWNHKSSGPRRILVGRHVRYRRADVEAWLQSQYVDGRPAA